MLLWLSVFKSVQTDTKRYKLGFLLIIGYLTGTNGYKPVQTDFSLIIGYI